MGTLARMAADGTARISSGAMTRRPRYRPPADIAALGIEEALGPMPATELLHAPGKLYLAGDLTLLRGTKRVAIIGSRDASPEGVRRAQRLASLLVEAGYVIVSGLAKGIDRAAHDAAIKAGGKTIAVIGTPLDRAYPAEHAELQEHIYRNHLVVSQFADGSRVFPSNFIARNRTMSLISHASVIVEAGDTSGSLSQAAETQRLRRPLFIMRSVLERTELKWPARFLESDTEPRAMVLDDAKQIIAVV